MNDIIISRDSNILELSQAKDLRSKLDLVIDNLEKFKNKVEQLKMNVVAHREELDNKILIQANHSERVIKFQTNANDEKPIISVYEEWMSLKNHNNSLNQTLSPASDTFNPTLCSIAYGYQVCDLK